MYRTHPALIWTLATLPVVALALGLLGIGPHVYEGVASRLLAGGWTAAAVVIAHLGPFAALLAYRQYLKRAERTKPAQPIVKRPAVDSGPFGRLIE